MGKGRLEAFSDGVLAIIITIMVLELKVPHDASLAGLSHLWPVFSSYVLSFVFVGLYWNNHHHMLHASETVNGWVLWANLHLLFWLSLIPFTTAWMGENHFAPLPVALYGFVLFMAGGAYYLLAHFLMYHHGKESLLSRAIGKDIKTLASLAAYISAIPLAFVNQWISLVLYVVVAMLWIVPESRIEKEMNNPSPKN